MLFIIKFFFLIFRKALLLGIKTISDDDECPQLELQSDGTYRVSVYNTCNGLLKVSDLWKSNAGILTKKGPIWLSLLTVALPHFVLLQNHSDLQVNAMIITFYVGNGLLLFLTSLLVFQFMAAATYDVMRQRNVFKAVRMMLRISDLHYYSKESTIAHNKSSLKSSLSVFNSTSTTTTNCTLSHVNTNIHKVHIAPPEPHKTLNQITLFRPNHTSANNNKKSNKSSDNNTKNSSTSTNDCLKDSSNSNNNNNIEDSESETSTISYLDNGLFSNTEEEKHYNNDNNNNTTNNNMTKTTTFSSSSTISNSYTTTTTEGQEQPHDSKTNLLHIKGESADRKRQRRTSATGHIVGMIIHE